VTGDVREKMGNGLFFRRRKSLGLWTEQEKIEIANAQETLKNGAQFVAEHFYYGVPVVVTRQSIDPLSPIWVAPDTTKVLQRVGASEQLNLQKDWVTLPCLSHSLCLCLPV
jgi:hypothetical protein